MENTGQMDSEQLKMQGLVDRYLRVRPPAEIPESAPGFHLDDDSLSAFAEGNLSEREARPIVGHLVNCSFCRHITTELVRLDLAFAENEAVNPVAENREPSRVSEVLSGLLSRIFGTSDDAVFAHHEKNNDEKEAGEDEPKEKE